MHKISSFLYLSPKEMDVNLQRVKVYRLNEEGTWDDNGTGHVAVDYYNEVGSTRITVLSAVCVPDSSSVSHPIFLSSAILSSF